MSFAVGTVFQMTVARGWTIVLIHAEMAMADRSHTTNDPHELCVLGELSKAEFEAIAYLLLDACERDKENAEGSSEP